MPWTPASHASFQPSFRDAIKAIALCAHRHGVPLELCVNVNSFMSRDWWPDERSECWLYECQIENLQEALNGEDSHPNTKTLLTCNGCMVARGCSKKHMKSIHREGHRKMCRTPPMRVPTNDDVAMCCQFLDEVEPNALQEEEVEYEVEDVHIDGDNVDDDNDWESVGSDEDTNHATKTAAVLKYFENKAYRIQRREEHAFASHYAE